MIREFKCPYGDDFEGGDECDSCEQYELCMETYPPLNLIEIPKGATNGDMIKVMFPYGKYGTNGNEIHVYGVGGNGCLVFTLDWWNAPYKKDCIPSEYDLSEDIELSNPQMHR